MVYYYDKGGERIMKSKCPNCGGSLSVNRLICSECRAEYPVSEGLSPYDFLSGGQSEFLKVFLKERGSLKSVGEAMGLSYPTVKKRLDDLLVSLGYAEKEMYEEVPEVQIPGSVPAEGKSASDAVKRRLYEAGGAAVIPLLDGKPCRIVAVNNGRSLTSDKLNNYRIVYDFEVFDCIADLLRESPGGRAPKGNAHGKEDKVGFGKCTEDTVVGAIAVRYLRKAYGESTLDPVFVLAAVLDWAGIAHNLRGYLQLTGSWLAK